MKPRFLVALVASLSLVLASGAAFAHDDGKGFVAPPSLEMQHREFLGVKASNAQPDSNAPKGFAPCVNGMAAETYPCKKVDMMSHLSLADLGLTFGNDLWGWVDPATGKEYALMGGAEGTVFVDITDAKRPDVVGILPTHTTGAFIWRDIKVYANHAYVVSEDPGHGMQVFDLTRLRGVTGDPVTFTEDFDYQGIGGSHNLNINEDTGFAYVVGAHPDERGDAACEGGLHMVDLSDPAAPVFAGCWAGDGYIHDTQCVVYDGPDVAHRGKEICVNSAATFNDFTPEGIINTVTVTDVTDKSDPVSLSSFEYDTDGYSHQGWLTPDQKYFLHNDELDELFHGVSTTTRIFDVRDLDDISVSATTDNGNPSIGHNQYTEGKRVYASNYTSGLRIFDSTKVGAGALPELGYFDTYPENDSTSFDGGTWSNYPYYDSRSVAVSTSERGLFVLRPKGNLG
ncbi:choice-of-anchor B family protein [Nocardioides donggukensis]|uniref:Choice-of-anchor B family protein n=1 Tax=Nocardioides donggukensis TaxID=2774019 RepID=A0A927K2X0_9ACTN|nr:choice-of-anchor B family protein [Nocardioides donggukensis]MBD8868563.1 choice-of-anchor B family protein [Nocardioides donggukensis]